ncbi:unnamed protein product [Calypogeia fissa]
MENFASILERDYGFKSGKNAPMVSGSSGGSGGGGGGSYGSGLRKSVPSSRMSANAGVFGSQDDPFSLGSGRRNNLNSNNEGSRSSRTSYGSREDLFTPAAYDDVFGGPPKSSGGSESGARYDDVFGGAPQGAPVYDDLLGGFGGGGGTTPTKVNKSASGSFHSSPRRSDRNHFNSSEPVYDELLPGFGFLPKPRVSAETKGPSHQNSDPFADPLTSTSGLGSSTHGTTTPLDDDSLLPGFESATSKSRSYSGGESNKSFNSGSRHHQQQQQEDTPLVPLFNDPIASNSIPPPSSSSPAFEEDDGLIPGFGSSTEDVKSRSFRETAKASASVQDSFLGSLAPDEPPVSSSIPSGSSPPLDDPFNVFSEPQVNSTSSRGAGVVRGNGIKVDRYDSFDSFPDSPANSSFFGNDSSSRKQQQSAEDGIGRGSSRSPDEMGSAREGFSGDDITGASPDSDPFFPTHTEFSGKSASGGVAGGVGGGGGLGSSSDKQDDEKRTSWDSPTSDEPHEGSSRGHSNEGSSHRSSMKDLKKEWLTVEDLKLMTQPSRFPPARRPPPLPGQGSGSGSSFRDKSDSSREAEFIPSSAPSTSTPEGGADIMGNSGSTAAAAPPPPPSYQEAVPGWMDFKIQPNIDEEREREEARAARERRKQEREEARLARESREKEREAREREAREKELKEREARQAREQERLRRDKEREKDRAAVRIATLEARERAAQEAREKAERSAVDRVTGEARERAASQARMRVERAAVERANAEARERAEVRAAVEKAQAEARERAEKAAAEKAAVERAAAEARERSAQKAAAERAAVERAQSEARERAARAAAEKAAVERAGAEARERAERAAAEKAAAARERERERERERAQQNHRKSENDLESFFGHSSTTPSSSEPRRPSSMNNSSNVFGGEPRRTTSATAAATAASVDDWTTIFGATPSSDDSQRGDTKTSRGKSDRMAHTRERAAKAIAEINQRDLELQREQAEKQRAGDVLDAEIKRWAAGKEGNLRALLSTLQYVLWPECGWTPVSLTDLINPASVKKTYRKATLYVHPDKVQQKGATVQQKYIAEKVFDLLKEASNKFNSEELF